MAAPAMRRIIASRPCPAPAIAAAPTATLPITPATSPITVRRLIVSLPMYVGGSSTAAPETSSILVLHLSAAYRTPEYRARGLDVGADGYLVHPVEPEELVATCRALLRTRRGTGAPNLRELMALAAVVAATSGTLDLPETMRRVARATARVVSADSAVFWIVDEAQETATPGAGYHVPKPLLADVRPYTFAEIPAV